MDEVATKLYVVETILEYEKSQKAFRLDVFKKLNRIDKSNAVIAEQMGAANKAAAFKDKIIGSLVLAIIAVFVLQPLAKLLGQPGG